MFHAFSGLKIINCSSLFFNRRDNKAKSNSCTETPFHIANHFCCVLLPHTIKLPPLLIGGYIWVGLTMRKTHIISSISCFQVVRKLMYLWISQKNTLWPQFPTSYSMLWTTASSYSPPQVQKLRFG